MKTRSLSLVIACCLAIPILLLPPPPGHFPPQPEPTETLALMPEDPLARHFFGISLAHDGNMPKFMKK